MLAALPVEAAESAEGAGLSPFAGNVGNAIWTLVIFVLVVLVLGKFAWGPVLGSAAAARGVHSQVARRRKAGSATKPRPG